MLIFCDITLMKREGLVNALKDELSRQGDLKYNLLM